MPWSAEEMLDGQHQRVGVPMPGLLTVASSRKVWKWTSAESSLMSPIDDQIGQSTELYP